MPETTAVSSAPTMDAPSVAVSMRSLRKTFGDVVAVDSVDLDIYDGEFLTLLGPSGSGKTTTLNALAGFIEMSSGHIAIDGVSISDLPTEKRNIGMGFQEFELLEYLTVLDNILLPYRISDALQLTSAVRERAIELAQRVGIGDKVRRNVDRLSHGERQRVGICRALVTEPSLVLADEPTGSLDPANKGRVLEILTDYASRNSATFVAVTHDHELLPQFDRVIDFRDLRQP